MSNEKAGSRGIGFWAGCFLAAYLVLVLSPHLTWATDQVFDGSVQIKGPIPWTDVRSYGAVPNDANSDHAAVQQAIESAKEVGGVVYFPPGTYLFSTQVNLKSNVTLMGAPGSVLKTSNGGAQCIFWGENVSNVTIRDLEFNGNKAGAPNSNQLIYFNSTNATGVTRCVIENCYVHDGAKVGINLYSSSSNFPLEVTIERCRIVNCNWQGIMAYRGSEVLILNNVIRGNVREGIWFGFGSRYNVSGNHCYNNAIHGITCRDSTDFSITNNNCHNNGTSNLHYGIAVSENSKRFRVIGNQCDSNSGGGLSIDVKRSDPNGSEIVDVASVVANNICGNNTQGHGIWAQNAKNLTIQGNVCYSNGLGYCFSGIYMIASWAHVTGNVCYNNSNCGISVSEYVDDMSNIFLAGNLAHDNPNGSFGINLNVDNVWQQETTRVDSDQILAKTKLMVGNAETATVPGSVVKKIEVFDAAGNSLGYLPVYNAIP